MDSILAHFGRQRNRHPVVHFYETFLSAYNPLLREKRGVYYTPEPVVIHRPASPASTARLSLDKDTLILDPAAAILYFVIEQIKNAFLVLSKNI